MYRAVNGMGRETWSMGGVSGMGRETWNMGGVSGEWNEGAWGSKGQKRRTA